MPALLEIAPAVMVRVQRDSVMQNN